jgi:hypothetical protein
LRRRKSAIEIERNNNTSLPVRMLRYGYNTTKSTKVEVKEKSDDGLRLQIGACTLPMIQRDNALNATYYRNIPHHISKCETFITESRPIH